MYLLHYDIMDIRKQKELNDNDTCISHSRMWCHVDWQIVSNVSDEPAAPIFSSILKMDGVGSSERWKHVYQIPGITYQKNDLEYCKNLKFHITIHSNWSVLLLV